MDHEYLKQCLKKAGIMGTAIALMASMPVQARGPHDRPPRPERPDNQSLEPAGESTAAPLSISQAELTQAVQSGQTQEAFEAAFETGDRIFEHRFKADEGVGANVGDGQRFTRVPRADLSAVGQWAAHTPTRVTGPNAQSCRVCHGRPFGDGAGPVVMNNIRDPMYSAMPSMFISRQTPHLFGIGAIQRLAEEMTTELHQIRDKAIQDAQLSGQTAHRLLQTKGIHFGEVTGYPDGSLDLSGVTGIDQDLIVKPLEWKGLTSNIRAFVRDAAHNELGLQATELTGYDIDGDHDGVVNELSVGDITALVIYQAAQPRPVTRLELADAGIINPLSSRQVAQITQGESLFSEIGCASCHTPSLTLNDPVYSEPSQHASYRDTILPSGLNPENEGLSPDTAIQFNLTKDLPDNQIRQTFGNSTDIGNFESNDQGGAIIRLYGDLKRHDMGSDLAESIDEGGTGHSMFLTKELWGVGSTAPYMHDGRATTLDEAIQLHGGESAQSRSAYQNLTSTEQRAVIAFMRNLILYKAGE